VANPRPALELRIPANSAYLAVLRTATAGLAARLDFTLDDIEDLRIAVDEACAMVLPQARASTDLVCSFDLADDLLTVTVKAQSDAPHEPRRDNFAWTVLSALTNSLAVDVTDGAVAVTLSRSCTGVDASP
jgi:serine/threonine-protein kinase RsbW